MPSVQSPEPSLALQRLVETHLRDALALREVMRAEKASLSLIFESLRDIPEELHATLVGTCMQRVAGKFIVDR